MLTIKTCKKILNSNGGNYQESEVEKIRDFLALLARIEISIISKN
jgi:hypothetical protein